MNENKMRYPCWSGDYTNILHEKKYIVMTYDKIQGLEFTFYHLTKINDISIGLL